MIYNNRTIYILHHIGYPNVTKKIFFSKLKAVIIFETLKRDILSNKILENNDLDE